MIQAHETAVAVARGQVGPGFRQDVGVQVDLQGRLPTGWVRYLAGAGGAGITVPHFLQVRRSSREKNSSMTGLICVARFVR